MDAPNPARRRLPQISGVRNAPGSAARRAVALRRAAVVSVVLLATRAAGLAAPATPFAGDRPPQTHWSFQRLSPPPVPSASPHRVRTAVDAFVWAKLVARGLTFAPDANAHVLVRRAYLDLIGLPPSPEQVDAFLHDPAPDAYERLLDRLLASPHFGERWGRHWLDEAGYTDVLGTDNDAGIISTVENKWLYRDYVLRAFNDDRPFRRFLTEQLAGDELVDWRSAKTFTPEIRQLLVATGFLRVSADDTAAPELNTPLIRHSVLHRTSEIVVANLLGLTFQCAKCHDHKYEPIGQRDYYQVLALLQPAFNPQSWLQPPQRQLPDIAPAEKAEANRHNAAIDRQVAELQKRLGELRRPYDQKLAEAKLATLPEPIRADTKAALEAPAGKRTEVQKYLAAKFEAALKVQPEEVAAALNKLDRALVATAEAQIADLHRRKRTWSHLQAVYDSGALPVTHVLRRGDPETPGDLVQPGFVAVLCDATTPALLAQGRPAGASSGRRLALARWLTEPESRAAALVLRVRVNRIWQHLFGRGIVETSDNLGLTGAAPTHPELLEWLAGEFVRNGQQLKPLLKLLMASTVYRQSSVPWSGASDPRLVDPDNRWLWRMRLRRLDAETVRDSILAAGGSLDRTLGGPPIPVEPRPDGMFVVPDRGLPTPTSGWRRSVYLLARRNYHPTLLAVFDQPNLTTHCTQRTASAVVLQSLAMLNDRFVLEQAEHMADRVAGVAEVAAAERRIEAAFRIALCRAPTPQEIAWCRGLLDEHSAHYAAEKLAPAHAARQALVHLCHMLINTSEFLYTP